MASAPVKSVSEICEGIRLSKEGRALVASAKTPGELLRALMDGQHYADAIRFMAATLPPRDGVWWACLCIEHAIGDALQGDALSALRAVVDWVIEPSLERCNQAKEMAELVGAASPIGGAGLAASIIGETGTPATDASARYAAQAIAGSVILSTTRSSAKQLRSIQLQYLSIGLDVSRGKLPYSP